MRFASDRIVGRAESCHGKTEGSLAQHRPRWQSLQRRIASRSNPANPRRCHLRLSAPRNWLLDTGNAFHQVETRASEGFLPHDLDPCCLGAQVFHLKSRRDTDLPPPQARKRSRRPCSNYRLGPRAHHRSFELRRPTTPASLAFHQQRTRETARQATRMDNWLLRSLRGLLPRAIPAGKSRSHSSVQIPNTRPRRECVRSEL